MRPPHSTSNAYPGTSAYCGHCSNSGMVLLDEPGNVALPCPMCTKGSMVDQAGTELRYERPSNRSDPMRAVGTGKGSGVWRDLPEDTTWERGLSVRHIRRCQFAREGAQFACGVPAIGQWCDHHHDPAHRTAVAPSLSSLRDASGRSLYEKLREASADVVAAPAAGAVA